MSCVSCRGFVLLMSVDKGNRLNRSILTIYRLWHRLQHHWLHQTVIEPFNFTPGNEAIYELSSTLFKWGNDEQVSLLRTSSFLRLHHRSDSYVHITRSARRINYFDELSSICLLLCYVYCKITAHIWLLCVLYYHIEAKFKVPPFRKRYL